MGSFLSAPSNKQKHEEIINLPRTRTVISSDKPQIILLFRFIGTNYHGLQMNLDIRTIEKELVDAIIACGFLPPDANKKLGQQKWFTASRTDTGVHACANVVSFYGISLKGVCVGDIPQMINDKLPSDSTIRVISCLSFPKVFNAQKRAQARNYQYLLPLHTLKECTPKHLNYLRNEIMPLFVGHLNYHNFTRGLKATNNRAMRDIDLFTFGEPFDVDGVKCVLFTIHGQAFMLNQIRMMVAVVVAASYGLIDAEGVKKFISEEDWGVKMIVGDGLFLDKVEYPSFVKPSNRYPKSIETDVEFTEYRPEIERWKREVLFSHIIKLDKETDSFNKWVKNDLLTHKVYQRNLQ